MYWLCDSSDYLDLGVPDDHARCEWWLAASYSESGSSFAGIDAPAVWPTSQGAGVTVAVVDSGVDGAHPDIAPNLLTGFNAWNRSADVNDTLGHGTMIAGLIAAAAGNDGYVGVAPQAKILPVKMIDNRSSFQDKAAVAGVMWAIAHGAQVMNLSWAGYHDPIAGVQPALAAAARANVVVAIAAGNETANLDGKKDFGAESPDAAGEPTTISVAAMTLDNQLAGFSNRGVFRVQIAAPGDGIESDYLKEWYGGGSGTSFAAPLVAGVAALLRSAYPDAPATQIRRAILVGGRRLPQLQGKVECGCMLDAPGALAAMQTPDTTPPSTFVVTGARPRFALAKTGMLRLHWTAATDPELEGYKLTVDGRMFAYPPTVHAVSIRLAAGRHRWALAAYDLADNETAATAGS